MNDSVRQAGARHLRRHATPELSPIARAIRSALTVSATVLALSAGPMVHAAGACPAGAASNIASCNGAFSASAPDVEPVDLTIVEADNHPGSASAFGPIGVQMLTAIEHDTDTHVVGQGGNVRGLYAYDNIVTIDNSAEITAEATPFAIGGYAAAIGVRAAGYDVEVHNASSGFIGATAISDGGGARARGVYATGYFEDVTVVNEGGIEAHARADGGVRAESHGVYAFGYGSANNVSNYGDIHASAQSDGGFGYATGITSIGYGAGSNASTVTNGGTIDAEANATYAYAFGVLNLTRQRYGSAYLANGGDIRAEATGDLATATGVLNLALRYGDAATVNTGSIEAVANGTSGGVATGLYSYSNVYNATVDNSGLVSATGSGEIAIATGIHASTFLYGSTGVVNGGDVVAHAYAGAGFAQAVGIIAESETIADVANDADIDVIARSVDDTAFAMGFYAAATESATLRNYGSASVLAESAYGDAIAYGVFEYAGAAGIGLAINGGDIAVEASAGAGAQAHATGINVVADVASVFNDGSTSAIATAGDGGLADARAARSYGSYAAVSNYGGLVASADAGGGEATARGLDSLGFLGSSAYNAGDIQASASAEGGTATAFGSYSVGVSAIAYTVNTGSIAAHASGDSASAYGSLNASAYYGNAITTNAGSISAVATGGVAEYGEAEAIAFGAYNFALLYDSVVDNSGSITASAFAMADIGGTYGFLQAKAVGAEAISVYGYGDTVIANAGDIGAVAMASQGYASAWGAVAQTTGYYGGTAVLGNDGAISAYAYSDIGVSNAIGAYALNQVGNVDAVNRGAIGAHARTESGIPDVSVNYAYAIGMKASSYYGATGIGNYGDIAAFASGDGAIVGARGIQAGGAFISITNAEGASILSVGEVDRFGGGFATGIEATGTYGIEIVNDGDIDVYGHAHAWGTHYGAARALGIYAAAGMQGNVSVQNNGAITATALAEDSISFFQGGAGATGVNAYAKYDATIVNNGDIAATAQAEFGITSAYGVIGHGKYSTSVVNGAGASIVAEASAGTLAGDSYGGRAVSFGTHVFGQGMEQGVIYNAGSIASRASVTAGEASANPGIASAWGASIGAYSSVLAGSVVNLGDIEAAASADFGYATAYGAFVQVGYDAEIANEGGIHASATAASGNAFVVGAHAYAVHKSVSYDCDAYGCDYSNPIVVVDGGGSSIDNAGGDIAAVASAAGGIGYSYGATAIGAVSAAITNTGAIGASTEADEALATGAFVTSFYGDASLVNDGDILASATGDATATATGAWVRGAYGAQVSNTHRILAGAYGAGATATAVRMGDAGSNVLTNTGTIAAFGDGTRIAVWSGTDATASIANHGTLVGAVVTGGLDDSLDNASGGQWLAVGESDFGAGDDHVANHGTLFMDNAAIRLGAYVEGNTFDNFGTLVVSGADNVIDMDNPFPVNNNGTISFLDGAPDDVLTVIGDFGGEGTINLDVSGLNQAADQLYIDGGVIESSVQALNVKLADLPTAATTDIALVTVDGVSKAGNFVLGNVAYDAGFLTLGFHLNSHIDVAGVRDVYSLGIDALGLNDAGTLAANAASGAAGLLNAQIGTFRQRMGVNPYGDAGKVMSAFFRTYTSEGDVEPTHASSFGNAGNFAYDQSVWGREVGVNANLAGNFHAGLVLGTADGRQRLTGAGAGSSRMDGMTFGAYATWFAPQGFYVDVSGRWMAVDIVSTSAGGQQANRAHAGAWNIEAGYDWTLGGVSIVPQVQYTRTKVDGISAVHGDVATFQGHGGVSERGRIGVELNKQFQTVGGVRWMPYASINAIREFDGEMTYTVADAFTGSTGTKGTSTMAELGLGVQKGAWGFTVGAHWTDGGAFKSAVGGQAIVRFAW